LRTRYSCALNLVGIHVALPGDWTLEQAHGVADSPVTQIGADLVPARVMIHVDPFDPRKTT
jgi:divalent metal cation (Fe/Co/Zn/Cd) transporter